jgi:lactoylglutathione lyase
MAPAQRLFPMLSVADLDEALAFYAGVLGARETFRFPEKDPVYVTLRVGASELGIGYVTGHTLHGQPQRPASGHRIELCVYVDDVDAATEAARAAGAPVLVTPVDQAWGERVAYVADPDGNLVMLTAPIARDAA